MSIGTTLLFYTVDNVKFMLQKMISKPHTLPDISRHPFPSWQLMEKTSVKGTTASFCVGSRAWFEPLRPLNPRLSLVTLDVYAIPVSSLQMSDTSVMRMCQKVLMCSLSLPLLRPDREPVLALVPRALEKGQRGKVDLDAHPLFPVSLPFS